MVKNLPASPGDKRDASWIPGLGRSPQGGHGSPLQYSCLQNPREQMSLAGYSPWDRKEVDVTKQISTAAAAAKSLQSHPTLCDPIDGSPPGSPIPGILQARTLEWGAIAFSDKFSLHLLKQTVILSFGFVLFEQMINICFSLITQRNN